MGDWIVHLIEQSGYLGIGFLMFLETVFPPIPSEVIMPVAGMTASRSGLNVVGVIASGTAGAMLGNIVWYLAARALGHDRLEPFVRRYGKWITISWRDVERAHHWFDRHGFVFVMTGRIIPTIRSLVSVPAGLLDMRFRNFVIASTIGTAVWTTFLTMVGVKLQEQFGSIDQVLGPISSGILALLVLVYLVRLARHKGEE
jgi:membrane protein DedA with SNARE-associated domain